MPSSPRRLKQRQSSPSQSKQKPPSQLKSQSCAAYKLRNALSVAESWPAQQEIRTTLVEAAYRRRLRRGMKRRPRPAEREKHLATQKELALSGDA